LEEFAIFVFDAYYIKFDDFFPNSKRKKKPIHVPIIVKKNSPSGMCQICVLDHSKTLVFSNVIKIEILFKNSHACAIQAYSSRAQKTIKSHLISTSTSTLNVDVDVGIRWL